MFLLTVFQIYFFKNILVLLDFNLFFSEILAKMKKIIILIGKTFFKQYIWSWNLSQQNKYRKY